MCQIDASSILRANGMTSEKFVKVHVRCRFLMLPYSCLGLAQSEKRQMTCISSDLWDWSLIKHSSKKRLTNMITSKYFKHICVQNTQFFLPSPKTRVLWIFKLPSNEQALAKRCKKASLFRVKNCRSFSAWPVFYTGIKKVDSFLPQI